MMAHFSHSDLRIEIKKLLKEKSHLLLLGKEDLLELKEETATQMKMRARFDLRSNLWW